MAKASPGKLLGSRDSYFGRGYLFSVSVGGFGEYFHEIAPFAGLNEVLVLIVLVLRGISIGFIIHLLLRGFWIGLVCLRSVYPEGINFEKLPLSGSYLKKAREIDQTKQIVFLDQVSGLVFLGSFLFAIVCVGIVMVLGILAQIGIPNDIILLVLVLYLLDLFTGLLRRNEIIGKLYLPLYWLMNVLSLGFIYRPYFQILSTNTKKWAIVAFFFVLFSVSLGLTVISIKNVLHIDDILDQRKYSATFKNDVFNNNFTSDEMYLDRIPDDTRVRWAAIQSDIIKDDFVKVFITYKAFYDSSISKQKVKVFSEIVTVSLNDSIISNPDWLTYQRKPTGQYGIMAYLRIDKLPKGKNELSIKIKGYKFYFFEQNQFIIPFWK
jgi:hypothetical protein